LKQQEAIIIERIEEVNNNWSIKNEENHDNGNKNTGNSKEMPLRSVRLAIGIVGKRKQSRGAPSLSIFSEFD
jgi:hypothetical protein